MTFSPFATWSSGLLWTGEDRASGCRPPRWSLPARGRAARCCAPSSCASATEGPSETAAGISGDDAEACERQAGRRHRPLGSGPAEPLGNRSSAGRDGTRHHQDPGSAPGRNGTSRRAARRGGAGACAPRAGRPRSCEGALGQGPPSPGAPRPR